MSTETVRVTLPTEVVKKYEDQAKGNRPAEWVMSERLRQFVDVSSQKPFTIEDAERRQLESLLGRNFATSEDLVRHLKSALSIVIDEMPVPLKPQLLSRLRSRSLGMDMEKFLPSLVTRLLEEYAGMR